jgi:hypothetical protein
MVFEVVLDVNRKVVFQGVDGVFGLLVGLGPLGRLDDDIGHSVARAGGSGWVPFPHLLGELDMCCLAFVLVCILRQALADDEEAEVNLVHQELSNHALHVLHSARNIPESDKM